MTGRIQRRVLFGALYMSEGAPIGFLWWALPTKLRAAGVSVEDITALTSVLVFPWVLKFLWAPLIDTLRSKRWTLRGWILSSQFMMGAALIPLMFLNFHVDFTIIYPLLILHAVAAATQDVSVDALCIASVPEDERGAINGWMQAGMLAGRSSFGGGALMLGQLVDDRVVIAILIGVVWCSSGLLLISKEVRGPDAGRWSMRERWLDIAARLKRAFSLRSTLLGLLFAAIGGAAFEAVGAVAGPYLIDRGFSSEEVGFFFATPVILGMIGGAVLGGYLSDRIGRVRSVGTFLAVLVANVFILAMADSVLGEDARGILMGLLGLLYFCIGLFTAASYALFMDITDPRLGATQFSAFMGATNGCESWSAFAVGRLVTSFGYPAAFGAMGVVSLASLPVLYGIQRTISSKRSADRAIARE